MSSVSRVRRGMGRAVRLSRSLLQDRISQPKRRRLEFEYLHHADHTVAPAPVTKISAGGFPVWAPARALHIGNIANNSYLSAAALNDAGLECDVLCYNYFHIMGSPEWEHADFRGGQFDPDRPDWTSVDLGSFRRPKWFAQGLLLDCVEYLGARRHGALTDAAQAWARLSVPLARRRPPEPVELESTDALENAFCHAFPERTDRLTRSDIEWFVGAYELPLSELRRLLAEYDLVTGFGTEGIWPLLAGYRPYLAFEHGTIRSLPFEDSPLGRLTALAYRQADGVVVTNADNREAAERLGATDVRFIPHPVNERWIVPGIGERLRKELRRELQADFIVFHPSRHHWEPNRRHPSWEKGNDIFIEGFARFASESSRRVAAVFVDWGQTADASRALLQERGLASRVRWIPPQHNCDMSRYVDACDLVADQFYLGAFGNITPKALASGRPAMLYLNEDAHRWAFDEMPPVVNVRTPMDVAEGLRRVSEELAYTADLARRGRDWYLRHHSMAVITRRLLEFYRDALEKHCRLASGSPFPNPYVGWTPRSYA